MSLFWMCLVPKKRAKDVAQFSIKHPELNVKVVLLPPKQASAETDEDDTVEDVGEAVVTSNVAGTFEIKVEDQDEIKHIRKKAAW